MSWSSTRTEPATSCATTRARRTSAWPASAWSTRSTAQTFEDYPNVGALLPAMGYGRRQMEDLKATIEASGAQLVLIGTPIDLRKLIPFDVPALRVTYRLQEVGEPTLAEILEEHGLIGDPASPAGGASRPAQPASGPASRP